MEGFDLASVGFGSVEHLHWFIEAKKIAFEDRGRFYADPSFYDAPIERLLSKEYAAQQRKLITERALKEIPVETKQLNEGDTIYLTTADEAGNKVSHIQSKNRGMASGKAPPGLGLIYQDRG